jgi:prephenate dehydrogenase
MAGKETRGASSAEAGLFRDRTWVLTPDVPAELETPAAKDLISWLRRIDANLVVLDCVQHDRVVSLTSHLAQLASTALAATVGEHLTEKRFLKVAGPGLMDMSRLALSSYDLWRDILATNTEHIDRALSQYVQELEHIRENLRTRQLQQEFARGADLAGKLRKGG